MILCSIPDFFSIELVQYELRHSQWKFKSTSSITFSNEEASRLSTLLFN